MSSFSDYQENATLCQWYKNVNIAGVANVWCALFCSDPKDPGGGTEASFTSYARVGVRCAQDFNWPTNTVNGYMINNNSIISFPASTSGSNVVTHAAMMTAAAAGSVLDHGALAASKNIASGDTFRFPVSSYNIYLD